MRTSKITAISAVAILGFLACPRWLVSARNISDDCDDGVTFRILTDQTEYRPGSTLRVTVLVTNSSSTPLYLFRRLTQCSSQIGSYYFTLFDANRKKVPMPGCSSDLIMDKVDVVRDLTNPTTGIALESREIFGRQEEIKLPAKKGVYRLRTELIPAGLNAEQEESLAKHHIRPVRKACKARDVLITIK